MIKRNRAVLIITSIIILIPVLAGVILWDRLPDVIATHFGAGNEANGWSSKGFTSTLRSDTSTTQVSSRARR